MMPCGYRQHSIQERRTFYRHGQQISVRVVFVFVKHHKVAGRTLFD
jgi:hypothetical protein